MTDIEQGSTPPLTDLENEESDLLIDRLPQRIQEATREQGFAGLIEVVLDLGRVPTARYH